MVPRPRLRGGGHVKQQPRNQRQDGNYTICPHSTPAFRGWEVSWEDLYIGTFASPPSSPQKAFPQSFHVHGLFPKDNWEWSRGLWGRAGLLSGTANSQRPASEEGEKEKPVGCRGWLHTGRTQSALFVLGNCSALAPKGPHFPQRLTLCRHPGSGEERCPGHCSQAAPSPTQQGHGPPNVGPFGPTSSLPGISRSIENSGLPFLILPPSRWKSKPFRGHFSFRHHFKMN